MVLLSPPLYLLWILLKSPFRKKDSVNWVRSKNDILKRANWLLGKGGWLSGNDSAEDGSVLLKAMPSSIGTNFANEWALYTCSHLVAALANISLIYDNADFSLEKITRVIDTMLPPRLRQYDTRSWGEDIHKYDNENYMYWRKDV